MRILLVRHGEARRDGRADYGLTPRGVTQTELLARSLEGAGELHAADVILSSPLPRARQTAEVIVGQGGRAVGNDPGLSEMGDAPSIGEGEELDGFLARVDRTLDLLARQHAGRTVIAVTHAGFIVGSMLTRFEVPAGGARGWLEPAHARVTEWRVDDSKWILEMYNAVPGRPGRRRP